MWARLDFAYSKLRVRKLKDYEIYLADKPNTGLLAGLGNMIMRNNLSLDDKHYKPGVIYYEKEYNRDFIHGTIMSLLSGATSSMGLTSRIWRKNRMQPTTWMKVIQRLRKKKHWMMPKRQLKSGRLMRIIRSNGVGIYLLV
jgi:hypothetical protein